MVLEANTDQVFIHFAVTEALRYIASPLDMTLAHYELPQWFARASKQCIRF